ncbi:MAG: hypothetical protein SH850_02155 [Planctomycetaceae bacterium]|nr:hypothetical protein [Planctomycetaceae bacterium]
MIDDPILDELYEIRRKDAEQFQFDIAAMFSELRTRIDETQPQITAPLRPHQPRPPFRRSSTDTTATIQK